MTQANDNLESCVMQDFKKLQVWHEARRLTVEIYRLVRTFPAHEQFGLSSQLRRSSSAIGAAIAEAFGRATRKDAARCLQTALSEGGETYHHLVTALDLDYITAEQFATIENQLEPLRRRIAALFFKVRPASPRRQARPVRDSGQSSA